LADEGNGNVGGGEGDGGEVLAVDFDGDEEKND
jgi:hypothetical protein